MTDKKRPKLRRPHLAYLSVEISRHGKERAYFRRNGRRIRLLARMLDDQGAYTPEFMEQYTAALRGDLKPADISTVPTVQEGSFEWLCQQYFASPKFQGFDPATQRDKRGVLGRFNKNVGHLPYRLYERRHMLEAQRKRADTPGAADKLVKYIRSLFNWAIENDLAEHNPAKGVPKINTASQGWPTWTLAEIVRYRERWPIGTRPRLALELLLYTGARRSDVVRLGRQCEAEGYLSFTEQKGRRSSPKRTTIPILPELRAVLDQSPVGEMTYLETERGTTYSAEGFGNEFRGWCRDAGLDHLSAHGLRKAAATMLAERGATAPQLCAIFGWNKLETAQRYIRQADKSRMADDGLRLMSGEQNRGEIVSLRARKNFSATTKGKKS